MRIRTVKPEFYRHRMHKRISEPAALLALALISYADDEGRFEYDPAMIESQLFPQRSLTIPIQEAIRELIPFGFVELYQAVIDGEAISLGYLPNFNAHQVINRRTKSQLPPPPKRSAGDDSQHGEVSTQGALTESSQHGEVSTQGALTAPCTRERKGKEGNGKEWKGRKDMRAREIVLPGDEKEAVAMCMALGVPDDFVKELFFNLAGKSFKDGAGVQVTDFVRYVQGRMMKKKNAFDKPATAPASGSDPAWVVEKKRAARLTELDALIDGHCANPRGTAFTRERTPDMRADFEKLWAERKRLRGSNGK